MKKRTNKRKGRKSNNRSLESKIYISAILLAVGVFLPLTRLPLYGDVSYHDIAEVESYMVIFFAISAPLLLSSRKYRSVIFAPIGAWVTLLFPAIKNRLEPKDNSLLGKFGESASSTMNDFAADIFQNIADFSWGGFVFLLGLVLFTLSCLFRALKN